MYCDFLNRADKRHIPYYLHYTKKLQVFHYSLSLLEAHLVHRGVVRNRITLFIPVKGDCNNDNRLEKEHICV